MSGYNGPPIDHGLLSPSGHMSKRARDAANQRHQAKVQRWWDEKYPPPTAEEQAETERQNHIESLITHAEMLEGFANRGYRTRYHNKHAAKARAEAAELERNRNE